MGIPYFLSAQLDAAQKGEDGGSTQVEGWLGLLVFNIATWVAVIVIDVMLLANDFKHANTWAHVIQTGAFVSVIVAASTIIFFMLTGMLFMNDAFASNRSRDAKTLPPFATALIAGGLKATLGFTYVLLITNGTTYATGAIEKRTLELLVAQVALKHFGGAMAMANQRLHLFTTESVVSATY